MRQQIYKAIFPLLAGAVMAGLISCDKTKPYELIIPPAQAHFVGTKAQTYTLTNPAPVYKVVVGLTDKQPVARTVNFGIKLPTGAVPGTHFTVTGSSVTFPADSTRAYIDVQGNYAAYGGGRKDTLVFYLTSGGVPQAIFLDTVRLVLKQ